MIQVARGRVRKQIAHDIGIAEPTMHRMRAVQKMTDALSEFGRWPNELKPLPEMPQRW